MPKKGNIPWNKGKYGYKTKPSSEEKKRKISLANTGKKRTLEQRKALSKVKKGSIPWNTGLTKETNETVKRIAENKLGSKSHFWREEVKYRAIHCRIEKLLGKPRYCEICKRTDRKVYDWSNKDHKYSLKKEDWQRLCRSCHIKYDKILLLEL